MPASRRTSLPDLLAGWLPEQRWFPGRGANLADLTVISDVSLLAGDPALRHLIVQTTLRSGPARFQVLVGYRHALPAGLAGALIGYCDGAACYDALHDPELSAVLLHDIASQRLVENVRFIRKADAPDLAGPGSSAGEQADSLRGRVLGAEQSNTSIVFGEQAILKVLRRLFPGANPDLEVADALAGLGSSRVARPYGWIETDLDNEPVLLGVLSQYLAGAKDGWTLALEALQRLYARHGAYGQEYLTQHVPGEGVGTSDDDAGSALPPAGRPAALAFADEAGRLGEATAELHKDLADAFGSRDMTSAEQAALVAGLHSRLSEAVAVVPALRAHEARIRAAYDAVGALEQPGPVQRVHGDYHLGQVMRARQGWVALDFEGEPAVPLQVRRAPAPALRDVAGMLRSFDYAARHRLIGEPVAPSAVAVADAWVTQCQEAFCAGYAAGGGSDPAGHQTLLRALTLEKAVYEVTYEYRHRPTWLPIPLGYVAAS